MCQNSWLQIISGDSKKQDVNKHFTYNRFIEPVLRHSLCNTVDERVGSTRNVSYIKLYIITVTNSAVTPLSDNTDA